MKAKSLLCFFQPPADHLIWHIRMIGRMADTWGSINGSISPPRNHQDLPMLAAQSLGNRILLDIQYTKTPGKYFGNSILEELLLELIITKSQHKENTFLFLFSNFRLWALACTCFMFAQSLQFSLFDITGKWNQIFSIQTKCISIKAEIHELQIFTRTFLIWHFWPRSEKPCWSKIHSDRCEKIYKIQNTPYAKI